MQWLVEKLRQIQTRSAVARRHRKIVFPERLEPRNAPGVMLPLLPFLEMPVEETLFFDNVEQFDSYESSHEFLLDFKNDPRSASTAARVQAIRGLSFETVEEPIVEVSETKDFSFSKELQLAAQVLFDQIGDQIGATANVAEVVAEELAPQLVELPKALTEIAADRGAPAADPPSTRAKVSEAIPNPSVAISSTSSAGTVAEVSTSSNRGYPTRLAPSIPAAMQLPSGVAQALTTTQADSVEIPQVVFTPREDEIPVENNPEQNVEQVEIVESKSVGTIEPIVTPAAAAVIILAEPQATRTVPNPVATPTLAVQKTTVAPAATSTATSNSVAATLDNFAVAAKSTTTESTTATNQMTEADVAQLLSRATQATSSENAIIAIVDRGGRILGVHVEQGVLDTITNMDTLVFAIDGAVAKARTAAFFSNNDAPLTSRTVRFISQSTVTQREVQSNPNLADETLRGPGFVAPIGLGGHFPPDVLHTPHVDLFAIEHTNRDSLVHPGVNRVKEAAIVNDEGIIIAGSGDDIFLGSRFGANFVEGQEIDAPESYGVVSGTLTHAQSRGIATLPGGVPLFKMDPEAVSQELVGGIGVFFPGEDGQADHEQEFVAGIGQTTNQRTNANLVLEAEYIAALVASNSTTIGGLAPLDDFVLNLGRIDLVGITLESIGPHPGDPSRFVSQMSQRFVEGNETGRRMPVSPGGATAIAGEAVPEGWLVNPAASDDGLLSAADVEKIILDGVAEANLVRSAIRLPLGTRSKMVLSVADQDGEILGLFRMPDSTFFSIDVAVAKARNVAYYANAAGLQTVDQIDFDNNGIADVQPGTALTNRTFRFLAEPRFPSGVDGSTPPPFSILRHPGINPRTGENIGEPASAASFTSVLGFDAFNPSSNFREPVPETGFQNGIVFFPGSTPLYNNTALVGGLGVSGDGVDQDDVVTFSGAGGFLPRRDSGVTRADEVFVDGVRLPYQKFLRNPRG